MPKQSVQQRIRDLEEKVNSLEEAADPDNNAVLNRLARIEAELFGAVFTGESDEDDSVLEYEEDNIKVQYVVSGRLITKGKPGKKPLKSKAKTYYFRKHHVKSIGYAEYWTDDIDEAKLFTDWDDAREMASVLAEQGEKKSEGIYSICVIKLNEHLEQI